MRAFLQAAAIFALCYATADGLSQIYTSVFAPVRNTRGKSRVMMSFIMAGNIEEFKKK